MTDQALQTALVKLRGQAAVAGHPQRLQDLIAQAQAMLDGRQTLMTRDAVERRIIDLLGSPIDEPDAV